ASSPEDIRFDVLQSCYRDDLQGWEPKIKEMVPSYGYRLTDHEDLDHKINEEETQYLQVK
ncbi:hypothetical protein EY01_15620, partial [Staphylococcus aureus]|uniref:malate:quinone oxidoreductase n=1 Tax=Staphylococcus aureus TaxID=1280 RepID=UPI00065BA263